MPRRLGFSLLVFCVVLNAAGFAFGLFEPVLFYDEVAHFVTPFTLVAIVAEVVYRGGGHDEFFPTPRRAAITGAVIGLFGAGGWELIEVVMAALGAAVSHAPPDTAFDVFLGVLGGALGGWFADRYLDRLHGRRRGDPHRRALR